MSSLRQRHNKQSHIVHLQREAGLALPARVAGPGERCHRERKWSRIVARTSSSVSPRPTMIPDAPEFRAAPARDDQRQPLVGAHRAGDPERDLSRPSGRVPQSLSDSSQFK